MTTHKIRVLAVLVALAAACGEPGVPQTASPPSVVTAVFDPITGNIPLPNDLALQQVPTTLPPAQQDLLNAFKAQGGFPNDQEVPITISFVRTNIAANGATTNTAPTLDVTSLNPGTLAAFLSAGQGSGTVALDPVTDADYVNAGDHGVLTLHNKGRQPWTPGQYVVAVRGGPNGVKTKEGDPINASSTFFLIAQGQNLETEQNLTLLQAQTGSRAAAVAAAQQLDQIINGYNAGPFQAVNQIFPHQELAAMTTFAIAGYDPVKSPLVTAVELDPGRGLVPLPIDLLRDPRPASPTCAACGKLTPLAACTLAQGTLDAQGVCRDSKGNVNAAAGGFAALDGFSTTGMMLAPLSDLVQASTVNASTVQLWELTNPASPVAVPASTYLIEPVEVTQSGLSPVIALQPAGATASDATSVLRTRPLKDATDYAVVVSDGVKDKAGKSIGPGTVARILQFTHPVVDAAGKSQLQGVDDATAGALEVMRQKLAPTLAASGFGSGHVAMAYTFHTQTILSTAAQLGALPYTKPAATGAPAAVTALTPAAAFSKYGVDPTVPSGSIDEILETQITTFNLLDPASGAFNSAGTTADETINVLIATPKATNANVPACAGALAPFGKCSPLVIFRHGLGRGRLDLLLVADSFAAKGFTVVAIDAAKHGDRSFCTSGQDTLTIGGVTVPQCVTGTTCSTALPAGAQGDANPPGTCGNDPTKFFKQPVSAACAANPPSCGYNGANGIPVVSSNYLVSANFFRSRDTFRQDIIDQSQLVRAIAFAPTGAPPTGHSVFDHMVARGVIIDPAKTYFAGQSLGSIQGTADVSANPRISRAVLNVGGGTVVDVFTTSPAFVSTTNALLAGLGVQPGANSAYLQFLVVAKTILDPADPVNFAGHLQEKTLPNLLPPLGGNPDGSVPQAAKGILTQAAFCDQTVPNPWNLILDSTAGTGPFPGQAGFGGPGTFQLFFTGTPSGSALASCPTPSSTSPNAIPHGFFTNWTAATSIAQSDAANFLFDGSPQLSLHTF